MKKSLLLILTCLQLTAINSVSAVSPTKLFSNAKGKLTTWFYQQEEVIKQEIKYTTQQRLIVDNTHGNINVKTWKQDGIVLKMVKHAHSLEDLKKITISIDASDHDSLFIKTKAPAETKNNCGVDYELLIPQKFALRTTTGQGHVKVKNCDGAIHAAISEGNIELLHTSGKIVVTTSASGSITIQQARGAIQASTNDGNIMLADVSNSASATTKNGSISMSSQTVQPNSSIHLTASGSIDLKLPHNTNAHVVATSEHGKVISEHAIKIEPHTTKLNRHAWQELKHNVEGIMGTGKADIVLHAHNGSIKLLETKKAA